MKGCRRKRNIKVGDPVLDVIKQYSELIGVVILKALMQLFMWLMLRIYHVLRNQEGNWPNYWEIPFSVNYHS